MKLSNLEEKYFKEITQLIAPSGSEMEVSSYLIEEFNRLGYEIIKDNLGSVFALKKSKNPNAKKVMICAHMDEVGFYVRNILDNGMIKPVSVGGFNYNTLLSERLILVNKDGKKFYGMSDALPPHLLKDSKNISEDDLLFDFGFQNKEEALKNISIGDFIVCEGQFNYTFNKESIISKAIDDRYGIILGLVILNELKDYDLDYDLYVGGTVQEEVGCRGALTSSYLIKPDLAIVLDCSPSRDSLSLNAIGKIGEGVLIRYFDRSMIANKKLLDLQIKACIDSSSKYQYFDSPGGTDAGVIHKNLEGILTLTHCICARSIHTSSTLMRISDYLDAKKSLIELLTNLINSSLIKELKNEL